MASPTLMASLALESSFPSSPGELLAHRPFVRSPPLTLFRPHIPCARNPAAPRRTGAAPVCVVSGGEVSGGKVGGGEVR